MGASLCCSSSDSVEYQKYENNKNKMATKTASLRGAASISTKTNNIYDAPVQAAMERLQQLKINFLAVDFDCTMIDIHTGGRWQGTHEDILPHVRAFFPPLLEAALLNNVHVAVVTFSPQVNLVRHVLNHYLGNELSRKVPIRAGGHFSYTGSGMQEGKQAHMASAVEEIESSSDGDIEITKQTSLLIDDDVKNVRIAFRDGVRAILLNPDQSETVLEDIATLI